MKIAPFIFNWPGQFENARRSEQALAEQFGRVTVINSDETQTRPGWIDLGNDAYFTAQFLRALDQFDGDVLFHLQADAHYDDWKHMVERAVDAFDRYHWGVFAPHVDWSAWKAGGTDIATHRLNDSHLRLVACTDCTCWMIHRDVIGEFSSLRPLFKDNRYGWGIDVSMAAISYSLGRPVLRDYRHTVHHPKGKGYDRPTARLEYERFLGRVEPRLGEIIAMISGQRDRLPKLLGSAADPDGH